MPRSCFALPSFHACLDPPHLSVTVRTLPHLVAPRLPSCPHRPCPSHPHRTLPHLPHHACVSLPYSPDHPASLHTSSVHSPPSLRSQSVPEHTLPKLSVPIPACRPLRTVPEPFIPFRSCENTPERTMYNPFPTQTLPARIRYTRPCLPCQLYILNDFK